MSGHYSLALPFDTDDPEFCRGVEAGLLYAEAERLGVPGDSYEATIHADNAEMVMRIAEARGLEFTADPLGGDWLRVRLTRGAA